MRLVLFFTWDVSLQIWKDRGLLEREVKFYEELAQRGIHVTFLTWGDAEDYKIASTLKNIAVIPLYTRLPQPKNKALRFLVSWFAPFTIANVLKYSDIFKTNQMWGGWCAALARILFRKPLIVRTGFELYDFTIKQGLGYLRRKFIWLISKFTYVNADLICVATQEDKDFVIRTFKIAPDKIDIRPNWMDVEKFAPHSAAEKLNHILYVGRLNAQKNLHSLIEAVTGTDFTLDIIGDGELRHELEAIAVAKNARVNFLGNIPNHELPSIYNSYPLFVLPSLYEGNPKALLEAMSCGRPALGTNVPGIASLLRHGESGYICKPDSASLKASIVALMADKDLRQSLGRNARRQIEETQRLDTLIGHELSSYKMLSRNQHA